jgi:hypothetical protein
MIPIAISAEAFDAVAAMLPGSVGFLSAEYAISCARARLH